MPEVSAFPGGKARRAHNPRAIPGRFPYHLRMDVSSLLDSLNPSQREAVAAPAQPLLVLAGAGSGKTRVLVHRIAWLIGVEGVAPHSLLAVTFTNKAAVRDARAHRSLLGTSAAGLWVGTFHGLRAPPPAQAARGALPQGFQIFDADDQLRLVKRVTARDWNSTINAIPPRSRRSGYQRASRTRAAARAPGIPVDPVRASGPRSTPPTSRRCKTRRRGRLRRAAAARPRAAARQTSCWSTTSVASATCWSTSSRTPTPAVRLAAAAGGTGAASRRRRRRPVDLRLARREGREHPALREGFPGYAVVRLEQNYRSTGTILTAAMP